MKIIKDIDEMKEYSRQARREGKKIGFVPTMGYLHDGHASLIKAAREECDIVVISVFVNPIQFGPEEDLDRYPRDMEKDGKIAEDCGADVIFTPDRENMYPVGYSTYVDVTGNITETLCGLSRPGHFLGVATVVAKLFNIVGPDMSYFGQKDAQQQVVVKRMVEDLNMDTGIRLMPVIREEDGLAMSSRNTYLAPVERGQALSIYRSLLRAEELVTEGERSAEKIKKEMREILEMGPDLRIDYVEVVDGDDLRKLENVRDNTLIAVAAFIGKTRLIDNTLIRFKTGEDV